MMSCLKLFCKASPLKPHPALHPLPPPAQAWGIRYQRFSYERACNVRMATSWVQNKNGGTGNLGIKLYNDLKTTPPPIIFYMQSALKLCFSWQEIAQLDLLCKQLYEATDTATRNAAERALSTFTNSPDCLTKCQYLLERGNVSLSSIHCLPSM